MDIAAMSMAMSQSNLGNQVQIALMSKTMDMAEITSQNMIKMMETSVEPHKGGNVDISL